MSHAEIIDVWKGKKTKRTPLWLMRQAGRYLPEYRAVREKAGGFLNMVYDPGLAAEITLQPLKRFDLDAAIIFSDILVIPQALGQELWFEEGEGPKLAPVNFKTLRLDEFSSGSLESVYAAIDKTRMSLPKDKALIGFAGGPFTLASYMIEGGGGHDFSKTKAMMRQAPDDFAALIDLLIKAVIEHLSNQIFHGVDAVQIFESHAGQLTGAEFAQFVVRPTRQIVQDLGKKVPVIGFARGAAENDLLRFAVDTGIDVVGIDQHTDIGWAARNIPPRVVLQGNLDPEILRSGQGLDAAVANIKVAMGARSYVFNLGHGVIKDTPPEHVAKLVELVHAS